MSMTIDERLRTGGRTTGFDYIRVVLAATIIVWHGIPISYGPEVELGYWRGPLGVVMHFLLPMFFALSGFLVAGSLDRCRTLVSFFGLRVLRIVPALAVEVTLSALIFGPLLTSLPLREYFGSPVFFSYFLNMLGDIHFLLPGLFEANPVSQVVNAQLWTIPFELQCYLAIGGLAVTAALRRRWILLLVVVAAQALWAWQAIKRGDDGSSGGASGPVLVIAFLCGILFHLYRDVIPLSLALFGVVLVVGLGLSALPHGAYYLPVPATYLCVYLGLTKPRPIWLVSSGDYSYGLYLYGYPLQQALASIGPATQHWWVSVGIALPAALLVAVCSWTFVEKPALGLRKRLFVFEERLHWLVLRRPIGLVSVSGELATQRLLRLAVGIAGVAGAILLVNANFEFAVVAVLCAFAGAVVAGRWFGRVDQPG